MSGALIALALGLGLGSWATQAFDAYHRTDWVGTLLLTGCVVITLAATVLNLVHSLH